MRTFRVPFILLALVLAAFISDVSAQPSFVNGIVIPGNTLDATRQPGANGGRFGFFSDIYYDAARNEWWALSDRGPGGGLLPYGTRVQRFTVDINPWTGAISRFRVKETVKFTDPRRLLFPFQPPLALNGLNPGSLNGDTGILGRSFDPEGLVIDPRTGHMIVADEYGPSVYEFDRDGRLLRIFETPANLIPKVNGVVNYNATRDDGANAGRQDNRGFEGLAVSPDGKKLYAVLQDPLVREPTPNNGRNGRNLRIVVYDNNHRSPTRFTSIAQYAYQLELQADVRARIIAKGGTATATDPRQGRNIGLSAITAINDHEFLVLERDNRGIGVDDPAGANVTGSKRIFKIDITGATDISTLDLPDNGDLASAGITPVTKITEPFIDIAASTLLPNSKQAEKWEGMAVGPRLWSGGYLILTGNDNDYSVTQDATTTTQSDVYVDFAGNVARCVLDSTSLCQINGAGPSDVALPAGFSLLPGVLHAYRASASDLAGFERPRPRWRRFFDDHDGHGHDDHDDDHDRR